MNDPYKSALDKITLRNSEKEKVKALFHQMDEGEGNNMKVKKILKPVAVFAASLVLVLGIDLMISALQSGFDKTSNSSTGDTFISNDDSGDITGSPKQENHFSVIAYAKELTSGGMVYPNDYTSYGYEFMQTDKKELAFGFHFPVECEGENIDTITYRIDQGAFHVMNEKGKSVVVRGEKLEKKWDGFSKLASNGEDEFYRSFTVTYDNQTNEETWIDVVDTWKNWSEERLQQYKDFHFDIRFDMDFTDKSHNSATLEKRKKVYDFLTKDMGITCTVTYEDGTTETKNIKVSNEIVELSKVLLGPEVPDETKEVVRCFSIQ